MAFIHGKGVSVTLSATDISAYSDNVAFNQSADSHDTTTFGKNSHTFMGGLKNGTATITGTYDSGASAPPKIIRPLLGTTVTLIYKPEGTGTGKPTHTVSVVVTAYEETAPVADTIKWSCTLQLTDDVATTTQA